jgi:hypothetical protein
LFSLNIITVVKIGLGGRVLSEYSPSTPRLDRAKPRTPQIFPEYSPA